MKNDDLQELESFAIRDAISPENTFEMLGGCLHEKDDKTHLLDMVTIREIRGTEEDIIANESVNAGMTFHRILVNCTESFATKDNSVVVTDRKTINKLHEDMSISDRIYMLLMIRTISVEDGHIFRFNAKCSNPQCARKTLINCAVDLGGLKVNKMYNPMERIYDYESKYGKVYRCKVRTALDDLNQGTVNKENQATEIIKSRVLDVDGKPATYKILKQLSFKERSDLRKMFDKKEGGVETQVDIKCDSCGLEFSTELDITQGDFFSQ